MNISESKFFLVWIFQTGEPLHIDGANARPMRAINLSNALVEAGHKVVLWSAAFNHQEKRHRSKEFQNISVSENLEIRLIPSRGYHKHIGMNRLLDHAELAINLKKALREVNELPDAAFIGYPPIETAAVLTRWLAKRGVPTVLDVKDQWPSLFLEAVPRYLRPLGRVMLFPYYHLARRAMRDATGLSAMAMGYLNWALEIAGREQCEMDDVFPLTSPQSQISEEELKIARAWWGSKGVKEDGRPRVCFIGSHMSVFDFKPVQAAAKELTYCEFVICGEGGNSSKLREMMTGLPNVYFPGWIDRPKIEALAERCQAALIPYLNIDSFMRSIPNKVIDAFSLGLPILTPLKGEVTKLIDEYGVGLRYGTDTGKTLRECIQMLTEDEKFQINMSNKSRKLYEDEFKFEKVYGKFVKHLENLAQKPSMQKYVYYCANSENLRSKEIKLTPGFKMEIWTPKLSSIAPKGLTSLSFIAWWLFHWLKIFKTPNYKIYLIFTQDGSLAHYTVLLPAHFRFPFMEDSDLQIGPLGTYAHYRKKGLAQFALYSILRDYSQSNKKFWYVTRKENEPSLKLIEKLNFEKHGEGIKRKHFKSRLLSCFYITKYNQDS